MRKFLIRYYVVDQHNKDKVYVWKRTVEVGDESLLVEPNEDRLAKRHWPQLLNWTAEELDGSGRRKDGGPVIGMDEFGATEVRQYVPTPPEYCS